MTNKRHINRTVRRGITVDTIPKPDIYNMYSFNIEDKYFCIIPSTGDVFEIDEVGYEFCELIRRYGWETGKQKFVSKYSEEVWESKIKEIKAEPLLNKIFFNENHEKSPSRNIQLSLKLPIPKVKPRISNVAINVAETCNFNCIYCFADGGTYHTSVSMMNSEVGKKTIDFIMDEAPNNVGIGFFGGEPLLNFKLIRELVQYAEEKARKTGKRVSFSITTNGYLITEDIIEYFIAHKFGVTLSIDGPKDIHDHNRRLKNGMGTFDIVSENAKKMIKRGVNVTARATLLPSQINRYYDVYKTLRDMGFKSIDIEIATTHLDKKPGKEEIELIRKSLKRIAKVELKEFKDKGIVYNRFNKYLAELYSNKHKGYPCGMARTYVGVSADGSIYPCHRFVGMAEFKLGTVWAFDPNHEFIQTVSDMSVDKRPYCETCWNRLYCGGGCAYENYYYNGNIFKPFEFYCEFSRENLKWAIWLYSKIMEEDENWLREKYGKYMRSNTAQTFLLTPKNWGEQKKTGGDRRCLKD